MAKRIMVKVDEYQKDGETKGKYTEVGVILNNNNGEYVLLDPTVNIAGVLAKQNSLAIKSGKESRDMVMASIFTDEPRQQNAQQSQPANQPAPIDDSFNDDIAF